MTLPPRPTRVDVAQEWMRNWREERRLKETPMIGDVFPPGWTIRTIDGRDRATYASWKTTKPWLIFIDGSAVIQLASLAEARSYFQKLGRPLETEEARKERIAKVRERLAADVERIDADHKPIDDTIERPKE